MLLTTTKVFEVQNFLTLERQNNKSIGFVPTMGALHEGHLSLIRRSRSENDVTVASIFVNPTQFNDSADFDRYPRTVEKDSAMLKEAGCQVLFYPSESEIYPSESYKKVDFNPGILGEVLEGRHRPGHFSGVAAVVKRLFEIVRPDNAYFGQKDFQQFLIIKKLNEHFGFPISVNMCPTLREADGLAMSSRNMLLSPSDRAKAPFLHQMLQKATELILTQNHGREQIISEIMSDFTANGNFTIDYFDICSTESLLPANIPMEKNIIICVAAFLGKIRLIDNILI